MYSLLTCETFRPRFVTNPEYQVMHLKLHELPVTDQHIGTPFIKNSGWVLQLTGAPTLNTSGPYFNPI